MAHMYVPTSLPPVKLTDQTNLNLCYITLISALFKVATYLKKGFKVHM